MGLLQRLLQRRDLAPPLASPDQMERILVEGFRVLSRFCTQMADRVESQRLERVGYPPSERFLERLSSPSNPATPAQDLSGTPNSASPLRNSDPNPS
jgi:hypothetical protein